MPGATPGCATCAGPGCLQSRRVNDTYVAATRVGLFVLVLVLVTGAGWGIGRAVNPPLPVPELSTPSVLEPGGSHGVPHGSGS
jgi:hypothetical protein